MKISDLPVKPIWIKRIAWSLPVLYLLLFVIGFPFVNVTRGYTGVDTFFGKVIGTRPSGWGFRLPFVTVVEINNQAKTTAIKSIESPTHDLQVATIGINSQWSILSAGSKDIYRYFGNEDEVEAALIVPGLLEIQKALSAKYDAYELQQKAPVIAEEGRLAMTDWLHRSLALRKLPNQIEVSTVLFPHVDFSEEFLGATTEQTQTEQSIGTYENQKDKAITEAEAARDAKIREAKARAYQIRAQADAETAGIIAKAKALKENPGLLCYLVHSGFNGELPTVSSSQSPLPFPEVCKK